MREKECQQKLGSVGECICPKCEMRILHRKGVPCQEEHCPKCNAKMLRVGSEHYQLWMNKRQQKPAQ